MNHKILMLFLLFKFKSNIFPIPLQMGNKISQTIYNNI